MILHGTRRQMIGTAIGISIGLTVSTVSAHHSQSAYEATRTITIDGTLKAVSWANPHSLFFVEARPSDSPGDALQRWNVEGPAPRQLEQAGWSRADAKIGEHITITGRPRRDGKPDLLLTSLVTAAGRTINVRADAPQ
jgi:uncharacterized protein DUF6152